MGSGTKHLQLVIEPSLDTLRQQLLADQRKERPNLIPLFASIPADTLTPTAAYLKLSKGSKLSFLLESVNGGEQIGRYSFIGSDPFHVITTGPGFGPEADPLIVLEDYLKQFNQDVPQGMPPFVGKIKFSLNCINLYMYKEKLGANNKVELLDIFHTTVSSILNPKQLGS